MFIGGDVVAFTNVSSFTEFTGFDVADNVTGTADSGTTTTLVDATLTQSDDHWNGYTLKITGGTNVGYNRTVIDFIASSDTLKTEPFPSAIGSTSTYVLVEPNPKRPSVDDITIQLAIADEMVVEYTTINVTDEEMYPDTTFPLWYNGKEDWGKVDGTNKVFFTKNNYLADRDASGTVDTSDVTVNTLDDTTWSEGVTVSAVDDRLGKITLSTAPAETVDIIQTSYRYWAGGEIPSTRYLEYASNSAIAYLVIQKFGARAATDPQSASGLGLSISKAGVHATIKLEKERWLEEFKQWTGLITGAQRRIG